MDRHGARSLAQEISISHLIAVFARLEARFVKTVTLRKLGVEDAVGDAILVSDSSDVLLNTVRAEWTTDPVKTSRMAYGLYPVACDNVQIINGKAIGTHDAGVYVGQSKNICVAGIEIENSRNAVVEFALPGTPRFASNDGTIVAITRVTTTTCRPPPTPPAL